MLTFWWLKWLTWRPRQLTCDLSNHHVTSTCESLANNCCLTSKSNYQVCFRLRFFSILIKTCNQWRSGTMLWKTALKCESEEGVRTCLGTVLPQRAKGALENAYMSWTTMPREASQQGSVWESSHLSLNDTSQVMAVHAEEAVWVTPFWHSQGSHDCKIEGSCAWNLLFAEFIASYSGCSESAKWWRR